MVIVNEYFKFANESFADFECHCTVSKLRIQVIFIVILGY